MVFLFCDPPPFYEIQINLTYFIFQRVLQTKRLKYIMKAVPLLCNLQTTSSAQATVSSNRIGANQRRAELILQ